LLNRFGWRYDDNPHARCGTTVGNISSIFLGLGWAARLTNHACPNCGETREVYDWRDPQENLGRIADDRPDESADHRPDKPVDVDDWRERRALGADSLGKLLLQSWAAGGAVAFPSLFLDRNDHRLSPGIILGVAVVVVLVMGGIGGVTRWVINERQFKLAEKLGRIPTQADNFGKAGAINIPNRYVFIGFAVIVAVCIAIIIGAALFSR
jgi:hypothetical protein